MTMQSRIVPRRQNVRSYRMRPMKPRPRPVESDSAEAAPIPLRPKLGEGIPYLSEVEQPPLFWFFQRSFWRDVTSNIVSTIVLLVVGFFLALLAGYITDREVYRLAGFVIGFVLGGIAWAWITVTAMNTKIGFKLPDFVTITGVFLLLPIVVLPAVLLGDRIARWVFSVQHP